MSRWVHFLIAFWTPPPPHRKFGEVSHPRVGGGGGDQQMSFAKDICTACHTVCTDTPGEGGGTSSNCRYLGTAFEKKWTQLDLSFCKNEGSKNLKFMEKGEIDTKCLKSVK